MAHAEDPNRNKHVEGLGAVMGTVGDIADLGFTGLQEAAWVEVIRKMEEVYSDLIQYDVDLERKNTELEDTQKFVDSVMSSMSEILIVCDRDQCVEQVNRAAEDLTGFSASQLVGRKLSDLVINPEGCLLGELCSGRTAKLADYCEVRLISNRDAKGTDPVSMNGSVRIDHRGRPAGVVIIGRPMGELRRAYQALNKAHADLVQAQRRLVQSEKLASLGRLVAGVAHELNNPISFINGNIHSLGKYKDKLKSYVLASKDPGVDTSTLASLRDELKIERILEDLDPLVDGTLEGAARVRDIVQNLRRLSFSGSEQPELFDLAQVVRTGVSWVKRGGPKPVEVRLDVPECLELLGHGGRIHQVIVNLIENALDAVSDVSAPEVLVIVRREGDLAVVSIRDNGCGIGEAEQLRVFDPFFTTKGVGEGTGLGLWISYDIVREHDGEITLESITGSGTTMTVTLPMVTKPSIM